MKPKLMAQILLYLLVVIVPAFAEHPPVERDPAPMIKIPAGTFIMGSEGESGRPDERPKRKIFLDGFMIDTFEVTNAQYLAFIAATGHKEPYNVYGEGSLFNVKGIEDKPVVQVTWHDAADYCQWAGKRLPTEAEWEKAAKGPDTRDYPWGNEAPSSEHANFDREWVEGETLMPVGSYPGGASPYGVFNLSGNAREWVQDWYAENYYALMPDRNPKGPESGLLKVIRGGSWHSFEPDLRTAARGKGGFALKTHGTGFRCARDLRTHQKMKDRETEPLP